ncbi:DinB family protein [Mucilaginibacter segetis]|uniref:DinB family protein n=1 Tax=Mucilaginibacter segetis TaxID=2793071 RepID=A0A934PSR9_9SPHI|nr:DinB family protein [Mucilaginibacter segetis]MBK0379394.1 DinB family protein [Mucilaginibacter segetis]
MLIEAIEEYIEVTDTFINTLSKFTEDNFNKQALNSSWTAAQVAQHILKSQIGIPACLIGNTIPAKRQADEKKDMLAGIFLDFNAKYKSPSYILPDDAPHEKTIMLAGLKEIFDKIKLTAETLNDDFVCLDFDTNAFGPLTRLEILYLSIYHIIRHERQADVIYQSLTHQGPV